MEKLMKRVFIIVSIILLTIIIWRGESKATLQANPNTQYKKADFLFDWFVSIRNMEKVGNSMGLSETLNQDLTPESESNNIDVHLLRSTEYGAVAILSASGYGNPQTLQESTIKTTTGNKTGVYFSGEHREWIAGMYNYGGGNTKVYGEVSPSGRYYDNYELDKAGYGIPKVGDALGKDTATNPGCFRWHNAVYDGIFNGGVRVITRNFIGLFSFTGYSGSFPHRNDCYARGVAVCGNGF